MKLKHIYNRLKQWWNITCFRFCVSAGKARWAHKFLDRIPLPAHVLDEDAFRYQEKKLWGKYFDLHGNLRLITWKSFFVSLLKLSVAGGVVFALILARGNLTGKIDKLKSQLQNESTTAIPKNEKLKPPPFTDNSPVLDMKRSPLFSNGKLYFPITFKVGTTRRVYYAAGETIGSESRFLEDCRIAIKLVHTDGYPLYYVYSPGLEIRGIWVEQSGLADLEAALRTGTGIMILPRNKLSCELRPEPRRESEPIRIIPGGTKVEFIQFAPVTSISTKLIWGQVKYTTETGQCFKGWIALFSFKSMYVAAEKGSDIVEVTDTEGLTLRNERGNDAVKIEGLTIIPYGARVQFKKFASLPALLSGDRIRIQVQYIDTGNTGAKASSAYTVWVNAGSIGDNYIGGIEPPGEALTPAGKMKLIKTGE